MTPVAEQHQKAVRDALSDLRTILTLPQEEFSAALKLPQGALSNLEAGRVPWSVERCRQAIPLIRAYVEMKRAQEEPFLTKAERAIELALTCVNVEAGE